MRNNMIAAAGLATVAMLAGVVSAATITGGSASWTLNEGLAASIGEFDALFSEATSRADTLALPAPGNAPFTETPADPSTGSVTFTESVRPSGAMLITGDGRTRQATTLDFDPANVLASWSTATSAGGGAFVSGGEQIGLTTMQRWTGPFPGQLLYGDFALRYTGTDLVLTSNIDFANAAFATVGNPVISLLDNDTLQIQGDLLIAGGLGLLDPSAVLGTDFGSITITADFTPAVPEPATLGIFAAAGAAVLRRRRRI